MMSSQVDNIIEFYSTHNVKDTLKEFNITYAELKDICIRANFVKSPEQIKETYRNTRIRKYGSIEGYRKAKWENTKRTKESLYLKDWVDKYNSKKEEMKNE